MSLTARLTEKLPRRIASPPELLVGPELVPCPIASPLRQHISIPVKSRVTEASCKEAHYPTARRKAARANERVESIVGNGEFSSFMISGISVQPSTTASQPR